MNKKKPGISPYTLFADSPTLCDDLSITRFLALVESPYLTDHMMPSVGRVAVTQDRAFLLSFEEQRPDMIEPVVKYVKLVLKPNGKWEPQCMLDRSGWPFGVMLPYYSEVVSYLTDKGAVGSGYRHHDSTKVWYYRPGIGPAGLAHDIIKVEPGLKLYRDTLRGKFRWLPKPSKVPS